MDIGYTIFTVDEANNEKILSLIKERKSFKITNIRGYNLKDVVNTISKTIEANDFTCRIYTSKRAASLGLMLSPVTLFAGAASAVAIVAHNLLTFNPDHCCPAKG